LRTRGPAARDRYFTGQKSSMRQKCFLTAATFRAAVALRELSQFLMRRAIYLLAVVAVVGSANAAQGAEWFVAVGGTGTGTRAAPYSRIQDALNAAQAGDTVVVRPGVYAQTIRTVRHGSQGLPIRLRAAGIRGSVVVTVPGRVLTVSHAHFVVEGLTLDGQYGLDDVVRVASAGSNFILRNAEVRRSSRDLVDIAGPHTVLIENALIHHALNAVNGRTDAHGVVAGGVRDLVIRNTDIHTFSGDGVQVDPARTRPGWNNVTIEGSRIWLAPLPAPENGFPAGTVPGENAVDTKAGGSLARSTIVIRDTVAWGFQNGLLANMAAFNLKENIDATVDRVTVHDSEIAFRLRGSPAPTVAGAWVVVKNVVVHHVLTAFRYEDSIDNLRIWNSTIGRDVERPFQAASSTSRGLDVRNVLFFGRKPSEAHHPSNLSAAADAFLNAGRDNYALAPSAAAINAGVTIPEVTVDRDGVQRPTREPYDVGAYEMTALRPPPTVSARRTLRLPSRAP
jgi:hypothetical protein